MKPRLRQRQLANDDILWQIRVQRSMQRLRPMLFRPLNCKPYDLSQRVNAGICPPRPKHPYRVIDKSG